MQNLEFFLKKLCKNKNWLLETPINTNFSCRQNIAEQKKTLSRSEHDGRMSGTVELARRADSARP